MTFFCIADKDSSLGFKLAGVRTMEASTRLEALESLKVAMSQDDVGVILLTSRVANMLKEETEKAVYRQELPLLLEIPSRGEEGKKKGIGEFLKYAVGVSM